MSDPICISCLNTINLEQLLVLNSHEYYHSCCYDKIVQKKRKQSELNDELKDITDSLEFNYSGEPINLNLKPTTDYDKPIGKFIDLTTDDKILKSYHNNINYEIINNILSSPDYATDIAGNLVKIDKSYLIDSELKKPKL